MQYGRAIRILRASRGVTQRDLAIKIGVDTSFISLLETGGRHPSVQTLEDLSDALEVPPHMLTLLAADRKSLRGITPDDAMALGNLLLGVLSGVQGKGKEP